MRIINKKLNKFSIEIRRAIRSLSLRGEGHGTLVMREYPDIDTYIIVDRNNVLIGWAICNVVHSKSPTVMMYVRKSMRRKGVGQRLINIMRKKYSKIFVCPWNSESRGFFNEVMGKDSSVTTAKGYW